MVVAARETQDWTQRKGDMKKRLIALFLACVFVVALAAPAAAWSPPGPNPKPVNHTAYYGGGRTHADLQNGPAVRDWWAFTLRVLVR